MISFKIRVVVCVGSLTSQVVHDSKSITFFRQKYVLFASCTYFLQYVPDTYRYVAVRT